MSTDKEKVIVKYRIEVLMKEKFKEKIDWISNFYDKEVNGFITGKIEEGKIILENLLIPFQESGSGSAEVTGENQVKLRKEYKDECKKIIGEWHSHHSLGAFWSGDDEKVIKDFAEPRETTIFIVSSKGHHLIRVEMRKPFCLSIDNLPYETEASDSKISKLMLKEIEKKVTVPTYSNRIVDIWDYGKKKKKNKGYFNEGEREIRKEVNRMVKFYNKINMVSVDGLNNYQKLALETDFQDLDGTCFPEENDSFRLEFIFKTHNEALEKMRNIKENLTDVMIQEDELNEVSNSGGYKDINEYNKTRFLG